MSGAEALAKAIAGKTWVTRFNQRVCKAPSGIGQPSMIAAKTATISARLHEKR